MERVARPECQCGFGTSPGILNQPVEPGTGKARLNLELLCVCVCVCLLCSLCTGVQRARYLTHDGDTQLHTLTHTQKPDKIRERERLDVS